MIKIKPARAKTTKQAVSDQLFLHPPSQEATAGKPWGSTDGPPDPPFSLTRPLTIDVFRHTYGKIRRSPFRLTSSAQTNSLSQSTVQGWPQAFPNNMTERSHRASACAVTVTQRDLYHGCP